ncbi:MAG: hypothetical protein LBQ12_09035, partial [Deltaproteobacteria bacterium]|nr:hypothetical protein [Deltaproteobacteria bacterium]
MSEAGRAEFTLEFASIGDLECHVLAFGGDSGLNRLYRVDVAFLARKGAGGGKGARGGGPVDPGELSGARATFRARQAGAGGGGGKGGQAWPRSGEAPWN